MTIAEVVTAATKEWGEADGGPDLVARVALYQREAAARLADQTAELHQDMLDGDGLPETERAGHRAIAVAMRSLAAKIRGQA